MTSQSRPRRSSSASSGWPTSTLARLAAELHHHAVGVRRLHDVRDLFGGDGFEEQAVGGVVVRRHRLRVVVHDVGLDALLAQRADGVNRAVVELDALPDADGAAADDDDALGVPVGLHLVPSRARGARRVVVRGRRRELARAGVDLLERPLGGRVLDVSDRDFAAVGRELGDLAVRVAELRGRREVALAGGLGGLGDVLEALEVPLAVARELVDLVDGDAALERLEDRVRAVRGRRFEIVGAEFVVADIRPVDGRVVLRGPQRLQQALLEGASDGHRLPGRLHRGGEFEVDLGELVVRPARHLRHHVVDGRLEGRGSLARNLVLDLVEALAERDLRRHSRDGIAGRLRRERRGPGHARIHFDDPVLAAGRAVVPPRELDVAAALDAEVADDFERGVPHLLVAVVRDDLARRDDRGLARVDAHRVDVLHVADDDTGVAGVPHHLVLQFDPARDGLRDQHLGVPGEPQPLPHAAHQLLEVVDDAGAAAAERVRRAGDDRQSPDRLHRVVDALAQRGLVHVRHRLVVAERDGRRRRHRLPEVFHALAEQVAVLGRVDGVQRRPHHVHVVLVEDALLGELRRDVQPGLSAEPGDDAVRVLLFDDLGDGVGLDGLDVHRVGHLRVRHDGRRVRVHEHDPRALLLERSARLCARVVELRCLTDLDRSTPDEQNRPVVLAHVLLDRSSVIVISYTELCDARNSITKIVAPQWLWYVNKARSHQTPFRSVRVSRRMKSVRR